MQVGHKWVFPLLWVNLAVAVVVLVLSAGYDTPNTSALAHLLVNVLVYANVCGVLAVLFMGLLGARIPAQWPRMRHLLLVPVSILLSTAVGCWLAQVLLMKTGLAVPRQFWSEYFHTLRVGIPMAGIFGSGALVHASLRERAQTSEARLREKEVSEARALKLLAEARLSSLESRIQPHFLFNTLNAISSLIPVDPVRAEQTVERLAVLLRASLDSATQPLIPLHRELAIVASYLDIQRVRFGNRLEAAVRIPVELHEAKVPPMSVQTLVENAVKHGLDSQREGGEIRVSASAGGSRLCLEVCDSGPGFDLTAVRAGHGLDNLTGRLDALFGGEARLDIQRRDGQCVVQIVLPLV